MKWIILTSLLGAVSSAKWTNDNCKAVGGVADAACCNDNHCGSFANKNECRGDVTCFWKNEKCVLNRDNLNNVCCGVHVHSTCNDPANGDCPSTHQVPEGCCTDEGMKWNPVLTVNRTGFVCCNTPCADMEAMKCEVPPRCYQRSHVQDYRDLGIRLDLLKRGGGGDPNYGKVGRILPTFLSGGSPYSGYGSQYEGRFPGRGLHDYNFSEDRYVSEITADDIMLYLIEALENDDDVYTYNQEIKSDPLYGKQSFGGLVDNFNYIDPDIFLNSIYGQPLTYGGGVHYGYQGIDHSNYNPYYNQLRHNQPYYHRHPYYHQPQGDHQSRGYYQPQGHYPQAQGYYQPKGYPQAQGYYQPRVYNEKQEKSSDSRSKKSSAPVNDKS